MVIDIFIETRESIVDMKLSIVLPLCVLFSALVVIGGAWLTTLLFALWMAENVANVVGCSVWILCLIAFLGHKIDKGRF